MLVAACLASRGDLYEKRSNPEFPFWPIGLGRSRRRPDRFVRLFAFALESPPRSADLRGHLRALAEWWARYYPT